MGGMPSIFTDLQNSVNTPSTFRSIAVLVVTALVVFWLSRFLAKFVIYITRAVANKSDETNDIAQSLKFRRLETYLSSLIAGIRVVAAGIIAYIVWQIVSPASNEPATVIGASALFIVLAGGVVGPLLNDAISGFTMIIERWYSVGDYVKVEPFFDVAGVVERLTLRSTKLRSITGEVIWLHNRTIHGVHVTPYGVRSISVDVFVAEPEKAKKLIQTSITTLPVGATALTKEPAITSVVEVTEDLWRITVDARTAPGREWLIENFFIESLKKADKDNLIKHGPIVRFIDAEAEKGFKRAVQLSDKKVVAKKKRAKK